MVQDGPLRFTLKAHYLHLKCQCVRLSTGTEKQLEMLKVMDICIEVPPDGTEANYAEYEKLCGICDEVF